MLQARHFQEIADALKARRNRLRPMDYRLVAEAFADILAETNGRFNRDQFLAACGL